jgi:hypothetical protein
MGRINFKDEYVGRGKNLMVENGQKKKKIHGNVNLVRGKSC